MLIQVLTTVDTKKNAEKIAKFLLENKFAACIQLTPIQSTYRWKGKIEKAKEYLLIIKGKNFKTIEKAIKSIHPYKVPEIIQIPVKKVSKQYLNWLNKESL